MPPRSALEFDRQISLEFRKSFLKNRNGDYERFQNSTGRSEVKSKTTYDHFPTICKRAICHNNNINCFHFHTKEMIAMTQKN